MIRIYEPEPPRPPQYGEDAVPDYEIDRQARQEIAQEGPGEPPETSSALVDVLAAPFRGVVGAGMGAYHLLDYVTGDSLPDWDENPLGKSSTTAGSIVENASQFLVGFVPIFGWAGRIGAVAKGLSSASKVVRIGTDLARAGAAGAVVDFTAFDGQQSRLSDLVEQHAPELSNPLTQYLSSDEDDTEFEARFKNAFEGVVAGGVLDGLGLALKVTKAASLTKIKGGTAEEALAAAKAAAGDGAPINKALLDQTREKITAQPKITVEATDEISSFAKDLKIPESGELFQSPKKPISRLVDNEDQLASFLESTSQTVRESLSKGSPESREAFLKQASTRADGLTGKSWESIVQVFEAQGKNALDASYYAGTLVQTMLAVGKEAQQLAARVASGDKSARSIAEALSAQEKLAKLIQMSSGFGTIQGRALNARKFIRRAEIETEGLAKQIVNSLGGTGLVSQHLEKVAFAANEEAVAKLTSNALTVGGKLMRSHNEYVINALLSGPKTTAVNTLGNLFTTLYHPLESAVGSLFRKDTVAATAYMKQFQYTVSSVFDSMHFAGRAFGEKRAILEAGQAGREFTVLTKNGTPDTFRAPGFIDAGVQSGDASLASKGLRNEAKAVFQSDNTLAHLTNTIGEIVRLPQRFLMTGDEFFKQLNARSSVRTKLYYDGYKQGLRGQELADFVEKDFAALITKSGELFSEAAVRREAIREADARGLNGVSQDEFISKYVAEKWNPENGLLNRYAETAKFGLDSAQDATFTRDLGKFGQAIQDLSAKHPLFQLVVPFVKTPTNMIKWFVDRAGGASLSAYTRPDGKLVKLPGLASLHDRFIQELTNPDPLVRSKALGRATMGQSLILMAGTAVAAGKVTGAGPKDPEERRALQATGWQPYSIVTTNEDGTKSYLSYQRLDPIAQFLGTIADWGETAARQDDFRASESENLLKAMAVGLTNNITNKTYLSGLTRILNAVTQPERYALPAARSQIATYIPSIVAQMKGSISEEGDTMREVRSLADAFINRIPGLSEGLDPKRNILGESVDSQLAQTPFSAVNPFMYSRTKNDPVMRELATIPHGFQPPATTRADGMFDLLSAQNGSGQNAYDRWQQLHGEVKVGGKTLRQALESTINSPAYKKLAKVKPTEGFDDPRVTPIRRIVAKYRTAAFNQVTREYPIVAQAERAYRNDVLSIRRGNRAQELQALIQTAQ